MTRDLVAFAAKLAAVAAYFKLWWAAYTLTNGYGVASPRAVQFTRPIDVVPELFQPWTAVIYVFAGMALPLVPFYFYRSWRRLGFVLAVYAVTSGIAFACYLLWPVAIARPPFDGPGVGRWLMREVVAVDGAANCVPSSHTFYAVLAALLVGRAARSRAVRATVWVLAVAVCATTITTGQHYFADIFGGVAVSLVGYHGVRAVFPPDSEVTPPQPLP